MRRVKQIGLFAFVIGIAGMVPRSALGRSEVRDDLQHDYIDDGLRACRQFEVLSTNDPDDWLACAWIYYRAGKPDSAEMALEKIRNRSYGLPEFQLLMAMGKLQKKQYEDGRADAERIAKEYRGTAIGLTAQELSAESYEMQGQLDTAAFIYKQVVADDDQRGRSHWGLGRYYLARGDAARARMHLEMTAKLWPRHIDSRFNLAVLSMSQDNLPDAAKWLSECYKLNKADAGVLEQLGLLFEKKGMMSDAIRQWRMAIAIKKDSPIAKEKLALYVNQTVDALIESKQWSAALAQITSSGKSMANDPQFLYKRGFVYRNLGLWDKAATDLMRYDAANPGDPAGARELGICYINLKLPDRAGSYFGKAIALEPTNGMNYAWMAYVLEGKGELSEARDAWRKALGLLKDPAEIQRATRRLATIEEQLRQYKKDEGD